MFVVITGRDDYWAWTVVGGGRGGWKENNPLCDPGSEIRLFNPFRTAVPFGDKFLGNNVVCPHNETAVLKGETTAKLIDTR